MTSTAMRLSEPARKSTAAASTVTDPRMLEEWRQVMTIEGGRLTQSPVAW